LRPWSPGANPSQRGHGRDEIPPRVDEVHPPRGGAFAGEDTRAQSFFRQEWVGEVGGVVVDSIRLFDAPARFRPPHDRVAIGLAQSGIRLEVVERLTVGEEAPALRPARMLAGERDLFRTDHRNHRTDRDQVGAVVRLGEMMRRNRLLR